jgi:hypothetical protein
VRGRSSPGGGWAPCLLLASCSPRLPLDAEINGCLERGARENAIPLPAYVARLIGRPRPNSPLDHLTKRERKVL